MGKLKVGMLGMLLLVLGSNASAWAFTAVYDQEVSIKGTPVAVFNVMLQDKNMKAKTTINGVDTYMVRNETGIYNYVPAQKQALKLPVESGPNISDDLPNYPEFLKKNNAVLKKTEQYAGVECDVYEFTDPLINASSRAWLWKEKNFPVRIEVDAPEGLTAVDFKNIKIGEPINAEEFVIPAETQILQPQMAPPQGEAPATAPADNAAPAQEIQTEAPAA